VPRRASMHDTAHAPRSGPTTLPNGNVCVMSRFRWSAQLPPILQARWIPYLTALAGCVALLAYWTRLGVTFYGTVEPFQDSSAYQQLYFNIIDAYRSLGYVAVLRMMRDPASTFAYSVLSIILSPVLPRAVLGLYIVMYSLVLVALMLMFHVVESLARSACKAFGFLFLVLSSAVFAQVIAASWISEWTCSPACYFWQPSAPSGCCSWNPTNIATGGSFSAPRLCWRCTARSLYPNCGQRYW
jgi:hypothetical protein